MPLLESFEYKNVLYFVLLLVSNAPLFAETYLGKRINEIHN